MGSEFKNVAGTQCMRLNIQRLHPTSRDDLTRRPLSLSRARAFKASVYPEATLRREYREFVEIPNAVTFLAYI